MTRPALRRRKLIEVALPLEAINRESAREKSIRHGHPSTLHLWWARRPLAACRAVLFAQLVDDPSARPDLYPTEAEQVVRRKELFNLIERLVVWENANDATLLEEARREILASTDGNPPAILDPFAGGGSIPLEAQRLGLEAHASDLNPVAVLINKALIEIPPKWASRPPVFPGAADSRLGDWQAATGLAEDVRCYGEWIHDEAQQRIGCFYPKATLPGAGKAPVIAWIWARTVICPNPACGISMPLVRTFWLGKKKGKEAYVVPRIGDGRMEFDIGTDPHTAPTEVTDGTVSRTGATCLRCGSPVPLSYIRAEGKAGRMDTQLMAIAAEGNRRRIYLAPTPEHEQAADVELPGNLPDTEIPHNPRYLTAPNYGMTRHADLFTSRQLVALTTLSDLVIEARKRVHADALAAGLHDGAGLEDGGIGASAYADSVAVYLGLAMSRVADNESSLCVWMPQPSKEGTAHTFSRPALPTTWDFAEANPMWRGPAHIGESAQWISRALERLPATPSGSVRQSDAAAVASESTCLIATDPPYYDNVGYADLSDFFYIWLRHSLASMLPSLFSTMLTPKAEELVADQFRHGGPEQAERFFEEGFVRVFRHIRLHPLAHFPVAIFYAFKQAESESAGIASTGWQTLLDGILRSGWQVTATWPIRTERSGRMRDIRSNALASSVVLSLRPVSESAESLSRRGFIAALKAELPDALRHLQEGGIAPVDLAQAAIGPGMAVFSRYARVVEADGSDMTVRTALALINQALDEVLSEQEGDLDPDSRFCLAWFEQHGFDQGKAGVAETLSKAKNTSLAGLERGGVFRARAGMARLLSVEDLPGHYDPARDERVSVWEVVIRLAKALTESGADEAARIMAAAGPRVDLDAAKELAYLLYSICERKGWAQTALLFNGLGTSWNDLESTARSGAGRDSDSQAALDFDDDPADED
jgi:putative DNA methylase